MAREVRLWEWLRDGLRGAQGLHMRRVENIVSVGDPDVDGVHRGVYFEIELKGANRAAHAITPLRFEVRGSQNVWHRRRTRAGGNNWIYVRVGVGSGVARYLVPGHLSERLEGLSERQLADLAVLPGDHSVDDLMERVTGVRPVRK